MRFIGIVCLHALAGAARAASILQKLPSDGAGRVLVTVRLQEGQVVDPAIAALQALGFVVQHRSEVDARLLTGHLPPARLIEAQALPAVSVVLVVHKPKRRARKGAGAARSQSVVIRRGSQANCRHCERGSRPTSSWMTSSLDSLYRETAVDHGAAERFETLARHAKSSCTSA